MSDLNKKLEDAKLSSAARKKLKGSTFCGPGRSFPVPDCAHVTAARRLIGRAKVSGSTKSRILSCVSRKASSMGCGGKDSATDPNAPDIASELLLNTEAWDDTHDFLEFMEDYESSMTIQNKDSLRTRAAEMLGKLRIKRTGTGGDPAEVQAYMTRSVDSVLTSLMDEIDEILSSQSA